MQIPKYVHKYKHNTGIPQITLILGNQKYRVK